MPLVKKIAPKKMSKELTELTEAIRPVYLISASINYALRELLNTSTKNKTERKKLLSRLDEEAKNLKINLAMLRKVAEGS